MNFQDVFGGVFDAAAVTQNAAPTRTHEPIPAGVYKLEVYDIRETQTRSGGFGLNVTFTVVDGEYMDRRIFEFFNIVNSNETAQQIGREGFARLCMVCGRPQIQNAVQLVGCRFMGKVVIRKGNDKYPEDRNKVADYRPENGAAPQAQAPAQQYAAQPSAPRPQVPWGNR